jgi:ubiquinone/menaquinone biosynthesis C-methylase UbiE
LETGVSGDELDRIRTEYERRAREVRVDDARVRVFVRQQRERALLRELARAGLLPLDGRRVLEVGCGEGQWLVDFQTWGVRQADLAGVELDPARAAGARERLPRADLREGSAAELPWADGEFDVVLQATLLSSLVDPELRGAVAAEMARVVAPGGVIVSYDMKVENRRNEHLRAVPRRALEDLFPGFEVRAQAVTLLMPLARRVVPRSFGVGLALERTRVLNTHLLAVLRRR